MSPDRPRPGLLAALSASVAVIALLVAGAALILSASDDEGSGASPTPVPATPTPVPNGAMWSLGTGGGDLGPYHEWVAVYPQSSLWPFVGAPSLRFTNHSAETPPDITRTFELGWYRYGPTLHTRNFIVEFWIGDGPGAGGTLSIIGNDGGGGQLQVRNNTDTDHISLDFRRPDYPVISTNDRPLYFRADHGLVSESPHTFAAGFDVPPSSEHAGQVIGGAWEDGALTVPTSAVQVGSLVLITPVSEPAGRWWIDSLVPGEAFTLRSSAPDESMDFNWLIVN